MSYSREALKGVRDKINIIYHVSKRHKVFINKHLLATRTNDKGDVRTVTLVFKNSIKTIKISDWGIPH